MTGLIVLDGNKVFLHPEQIFKTAIQEGAKNER
jgi:hypothetical protein